MEVEVSQTQKTSQVTLKDISYFLSNHLDDKDRSNSLEERTNCAIVLLESLPCGRHAVLEKIGEVFFDEAQKYVVELERLHLAGHAAIYETNSSKLDAQIRKIQQVLVSFVESNPKTWGPMIFNWTVQTLSQICVQYGTKRHFSSFILEERLQMWLNCTATFVLLEIMVSCLHKIIYKNQDNCVKCLLNASLMSAPFFNWALAHVCSVFPSILPYKLLSHAAEAFSKQSRKIDMIMDTLLSIFDIIHVQKEGHINDALYKLFNDSLSAKKEDHAVLCTVPFLLQICNKSPKLVKPLVDKAIQSMTHSNMHTLHAQSLRRDEILQRRALSRITDCIKEVDQSGHKILDFLIRYSCNEDKKLSEDDSLLALSAQSYCSLILELLYMLLANESNVYLHYNGGEMKDQNSGPPEKSPFLFSLERHTKPLCQQMLNSYGIKRNILQEMLKLIALQLGLAKMCEILTFILINSSLERSKTCFMHFVRAFEIYQPNIIKETFANAFHFMTSVESSTYTQVKMFLKNILKLEREEKSSIVQDTLTLIKPYVKYIAQMTVLSCDRADISSIALELLHKLSVSDVLIAEYAIVVQTVLAFYFKTIKQVSVPNLDEHWSKLKSCNFLLLRTINQYMSVHQFIIRVLVEGIVRKKTEQFGTEPEKPLISVELVKQNLTMVQGNRFNTITSVSFKDGLKLTKDVADDYDLWKKSYTCQLFINTLSSLLSLSGYGNAKATDHVGKGSKFMHLWSEKKYISIFPTAHAFLATVLVELVCPEMVPVTPWPDEDFLKYTIERDLKVKNTFDTQPLLWEVLELISSSRPSLYHCSVIVQSLFGMSLKFWQTNRNLLTRSSPIELNYTYKIMRIVKNAGWLPSEIDTISDIFPFIKPKEVYEILSVIWVYLKNTNYAPDRFVDRDPLNLPSVPANSDCLQNVKAVVQIVFLRNITTIGYLYSRFLGDNQDHV